MISERLFEKIIYVSKRGQLIDKRLIMNLVRDIISKTDFRTRHLFSRVVFTNNILFSACTNQESGMIAFNLKNCYELADELECASVLEKNLHILALIFHEVEHLKEINKVKKDSFEGKLIKISNKQTDYYKNGEVNYHTYYKNPSEKIAYAMSYKNLLEFLNSYDNFKEIYPEEYAAINNRYVEMLMNGYEFLNGKYNTPLIDFIVAIKNKSCLKDIKFKLVKSGKQKNIDKISIEKRFMYGFPINEENVNKLNKKKILTRSTK